MDDLGMEEVSEYDFSESQIVEDGFDNEPCTVAMPSYGRGLKAPDLKQLKMPFDFYLELNDEKLQNLVQTRTKPLIISKGRGQLIVEDCRKCTKLESHINKSRVMPISDDVMRYSNAYVDDVASESDSYITANLPSRSCMSPSDESPECRRDKEDIELH